ncbi:10779_t:CDS:1, partial [Funneliformis geosporum]
DILDCESHLLSTSEESSTIISIFFLQSGNRHTPVEMCKSFLSIQSL